jgi:hypothetical protein
MRDYQFLRNDSPSWIQLTNLKTVGIVILFKTSAINVYASHDVHTRKTNAYMDGLSVRPHDSTQPLDRFG